MKQFLGFVCTRNTNLVLVYISSLTIFARILTAVYYIWTEISEKCVEYECESFRNLNFQPV